MANTKITADNLAANAVTSASIADNSIGITQLNVSDGTNGQVLTTNGSGTLSFSTISGYTDSDVETYLNTSLIYTDPTNNRLGIGTSSPDQPLTVVGSTAIAGKFLGEGGPHGLNIGGNDQGFGYIGHVSSGSYDLTLTSSGNVGIGTSSPTGKLHVSGGRMGVISSNTHSSWGHFRIGNTNDNEISMAYVNGAVESDFLGDSNPSCAYKVVTGINAYGAGSRAFAIGNDYLANYHTMWTKEGHQLPRANNTYDLGSTTQGWRNIYTNDLNLSNLPPEGIDTEGNPYTREGNEVDGTNGSWTIQEGADDLFLINRVNGKKYKFNLTEITE